MAIASPIVAAALPAITTVLLLAKNCKLLVLLKTPVALANNIVFADQPVVDRAQFVIRARSRQ